MGTIHESANIHSTAIVSDGAVIGAGTIVGPYSIIGSRVVLGRENDIRSHVVIEGNTQIGDQNTVFQFASVGSAPQDLKYRGEDSILKIGNRNKIREYVTLQPGTEGGGMQTLIGDENLFMAQSHVGHDGKVGNRNVFANGVALAGHVTVGDGVILGGASGIHQFVKLGDLSLIGAGAMVAKDVPPYCIAQGDRACLVGVNTIGLQRNKFSDEEVRAIRNLFRDLFMGSGTLQERVTSLRSTYATFSRCMTMLDFVASSERGVCGMRRKGQASDDAYSGPQK